MPSLYKSKGVVPPGGMVRYRDPDDGWRYAHPYYDNVAAAARAHRVSAGLPVPYNWPEVLDAAICKETPQACVEVPVAKEEAKHTLMQMAGSFTRESVKWARSGFPLVDYDCFRERFLTCAGDEDHPQCPYFQRWTIFGVPRCGACGCVASIKLHWATAKCPKGKWRR